MKINLSLRGYFRGGNSFHLAKFGRIWIRGGFVKDDKVKIQKTVTANAKGEPTPNGPEFKTNDIKGEH